MPELTRARLIYDGLPELCEGFKSWQEALIGILRDVYAEIPNTITNVKISNEAPDDGQTDYLWGKLDNGGNFVGFAIFAQGDWRVISAPAPAGALYLISGNSASIPPGFAIADSVNVQGPSNLAALQANWNPPGATGPWSLFHVIYTGF